MLVVKHLPREQQLKGFLCARSSYLTEEHYSSASEWKCTTVRQVIHLTETDNIQIVRNFVRHTDRNNSRLTWRIHYPVVRNPYHAIDPHQTAARRCAAYLPEHLLIGPERR